MPMVSPILVMISFYTVVDASTDSSNIMVRLISRYAANIQLSQSAMASTVWFGVIMVFAGIIFLFSRKSVHYIEE